MWYVMPWFLFFLNHNTLMDGLDTETKLKIYTLIVNRYKDFVNKNEERSVSEIRQRVSPYDDYVKQFRDRLIEDLQPYNYDKHFFSAVQKILVYVRSLKTFRNAVTFWMDFKDIADVGAASIMDKAILMAALFRALDSKDVKVMVTKSGKTYVGFSWNGELYLILPDTGSMLTGSDATNGLAEDPVSYAFSDLFYESYEEE